MPDADADRAGRTRRGELHEPEALVDRVVVVGVEPDLLVERLGPVDVRHGDRDQLELEVHEVPFDRRLERAVAGSCCQRLTPLLTRSVRVVVERPAVVALGRRGAHPRDERRRSRRGRSPRPGPAARRPRRRRGRGARPRVLGCRRGAGHAAPHPAGGPPGRPRGRTGGVVGHRPAGAVRHVRPARCLWRAPSTSSSPGSTRAPTRGGRSTTPAPWGRPSRPATAASPAWR